jgi:hypothetical protein
MPARTSVQVEEIWFHWMEAFSENFTGEGLVLKCVRKFIADQNRKNKKHFV